MLVALLLIIISSALVIAVNYLSIPNSGNLGTEEIKAYRDSQCTQSVGSINWGILELGNTKNITVFLRNEGNLDVTLTLNITDWNPSVAKDYITLTWDYNSQILHPNDVLSVIFTLGAPSDSHGITCFSFDTVITADS